MCRKTRSETRRKETAEFAGKAWEGSVCRRPPALAVLRGDMVATRPPLTLQSDGLNANNLLILLVPVAGVEPATY